jgi:hypothetical protein
VQIAGVHQTQRLGHRRLHARGTIRVGPVYPAAAVSPTSACDAIARPVRRAFIWSDSSSLRGRRPRRQFRGC